MGLSLLSACHRAALILLLVSMEAAKVESAGSSSSRRNAQGCFLPTMPRFGSSEGKIRPVFRYSPSQLFASQGASSVGIDALGDLDSLPSDVTPVATNANADTHNPHAEQFSDYYRQDLRDSNAAAFLKNLSQSQQEELKGYLQTLHQARKAKNYTASDEICALLRRQFGVRIYNDPPMWTTLKGAAPPSYLRQKQQKIDQTLRDLYGPFGHPYRHVGGEDGIIDSILCPLSITEIHTLLSRKTQARMEGRYEDVDAIGFELLINGVHCNDELEQWRADGQNDVWEENPEQNSIEKKNISIFDYVEKPIKEPQREEPHIRKRVNQLIHLRSGAVVRDDGFLLQALTKELLQTYGVVVDDGQKTWSFQRADLPKEEDDVTTTITSAVITEPMKEGRTEELVPPLLFAAKEEEQAETDLFQVSRFSQAVPNDTTLTRIKQLVQERSEKRAQSKFLEADAIRRELWMTYHVGVNDRVRQWSVGGVFDDNNDDNNDRLAQ